MTTHNPHYHGNFAGLAPRGATSARGTTKPTLEVGESDRTGSDVIALVMAYMLGLAALAVIAASGQFPWFLLSLAGGAAIAAAVPRSKSKRLTRDRESVISA